MKSQNFLRACGAATYHPRCPYACGAASCHCLSIADNGFKQKRRASRGGLFVACHGFNQRLRATMKAYPSCAMASISGSEPLGGLIDRRPLLQSAAPRLYEGLSVVCHGFNQRLRASGGLIDRTIAGHCFNQRLRASWRAYPSQAMASIGGSAPLGQLIHHITSLHPMAAWQ